MIGTIERTRQWPSSVLGVLANCPGLAFPLLLTLYFVSEPLLLLIYGMDPSDESISRGQVPGESENDIMDDLANDDDSDVEMADGTVAPKSSDLGEDSYMFPVEKRGGKFVVEIHKV